MSRAWVFQERYLSPRKLFFGHAALMWECSKSFSDELCGPQMRPVIPFVAFQSPVDGLAEGSKVTNLGISHMSPANDDICAAIGSWRKLCQGYRLKKLANPNDRTTAFAGIAKRFCGQYGGVYLAGLWKTHLHLYLLWYIFPQENDGYYHKSSLAGLYEASCGNPLENREQAVPDTPTWSWFSRPFYHSLEWSWYFILPPDEFTIVWLAKMESANLHRGTANLSLNRTNIPSSIFTDFTGLRITLSCLTVSTIVDRDQSQMMTLQPPAYKLCQEHSFQYFHDDYESIEVDLKGMNPVIIPQNVILACIIDYVVEWRFGAPKAWEQSAGLALIPSPKEEGVWVRIGLWCLKRELLDDDEQIKEASRPPLISLYPGCKEQTITIA